MIVTLRPNDRLIVKLMNAEGDESDGEIALHYQTAKYPNGLTIVDATSGVDAVLFSSLDDDDADMFTPDAEEAESDRIQKEVEKESVSN